TTGGAPAGTVSLCTAATDATCGSLQALGTTQITHTQRHTKDANSQVTFSFNYTAPASGCYIDKLEIWINNVNANGLPSGDRGARFDATSRNSGIFCRAPAGACDVANSCTADFTNHTNTCPAEGFASTTPVCRAAANECDIAENCTGSSAVCPADTVKAAGT